MWRTILIPLVKSFALECGQNNKYLPWWSQIVLITSTTLLTCRPRLMLLSVQSQQYLPATLASIFTHDHWSDHVRYLLVTLVSLVSMSVHCYSAPNYNAHQNTFSSPQYIQLENFILTICIWLCINTSRVTVDTPFQISAPVWRLIARIAFNRDILLPFIAKLPLIIGGFF